MARFPEIHLPVIYDDLSSARVLTMEFVRGIKISGRRARAGFDTTRWGQCSSLTSSRCSWTGFPATRTRAASLPTRPRSGSSSRLGLVGQLTRPSGLPASSAPSRSRHPGTPRLLTSASRRPVRRGCLSQRHRPARPAVPGHGGASSWARPEQLHGRR
jgi:hypothetical protein